MEAVMKKIAYAALALMILVSGIALIPVMGLPVQGFNWQLFANVYEQPTLEVNHLSGKPGSFFTFTATGLSPNTKYSITANGALLGEVETDDDGNLTFVLNTSQGNPGHYLISVDAETSTSIRAAVEVDSLASTRIWLSEEAPLWEQDTTAPILILPADIEQHLIFMSEMHQDN